MVVSAHSLVAPRGAMGCQWSLAPYFWYILMCSVVCQFCLTERTRHDFQRHLINVLDSNIIFISTYHRRTFRCNGEYST